MRMWMTPPAGLCRKHLLGEHVETHMLHGTIKLGRSLRGYVENGLVETASLQARHDALVAEMQARGYRHATPLDYHDTLNLGQVDVAISHKELARRCAECRQQARRKSP